MVVTMTWNNTSAFSTLVISILSGLIIILLLTIASCEYFASHLLTEGNPTNHYLIFIAMAITTFFCSIILVKLIHNDQLIKEEE
jgi:hypothetical protein